MAATLERRGARRVTVIPNWADGQALHPNLDAGARFREEHGLAGRFVVLYSGNLGLAHRFDAVALAARELATLEPRVCWLIVGHGPRLAEFAQTIYDLESVIFLEYQPREALNALYNAADLHLVTLEDAVAGLLVPSKYAAALAAGRPVLVVGGEGTDLHREIRQDALGWCCPHSPAAVVAAIREAVADPQETLARGRAGRRLFDERYARALTSRAWETLLASLDEPGPGGAAHA